MDAEIRKRLEAQGWATGDARDFLGLTDEEARIIEWRVSLGQMIREKRKAKGYTQTVLAKEIGSNQARVARMEAGDSSVSIDTLLKTLFHMGAGNGEICGYVEVGGKIV